MHDNNSRLPSGSADGSIKDDLTQMVDTPVDFYYVQRGPSASVPLPDADNYYVVHEMQWTDAYKRVFYVMKTPDPTEASVVASAMRRQVVYLTAQQCAERYGLAASTWRAACAAGRIPGATRCLPHHTSARSRCWYIPEQSAQKYAQRARASHVCDQQRSTSDSV